MTKNNKRKKHGAGKRRQFRAGLLLVAMLLTAMAAGCFRKPSNPTEPLTMTTEPPEATVTPALSGRAAKNQGLSHKVRRSLIS